MEASSRFAPLPESPARARAFTADTLQSWGCGGLIDVAQLLVSELVTNVVLHAGTDAVLSIGLRPDRLRIEVADGSVTVPHTSDSTSNGTSGRGLPIVEVIGDDWGVEQRHGGKTVWTEIRIPAAL